MLPRLGPGSFSFVMATGIASVGASYEGRALLSQALFGLAAAAYVAVGLLVLRARALRRGVEAFAFVAASGVLAARLLVDRRLTGSLPLFALAAVSWALLAARPALPRPARGIWLLAVVGTQSLAVVAAMVAGRVDSGALLDAALAWWALGLALYPLAAAAVLRARQPFAPDHWILTGALAISALAAGQLADVRPVLDDAALAVWAAASALVLPLAVAHVRALARRTQAPGPVWTFVFPLGMYSVATVVTGNATGEHGLVAAGHGFFWLALAAWAVTATTVVVRMLPPWANTARSRSSTTDRRPATRSSAPRSSSS